MKVTQSCPALCDRMDCKSTRLLCPWDSPGKNTGMGCHALLQGRQLSFFFSLSCHLTPEFAFSITFIGVGVRPMYDLQYFIPPPSA